MAAPTAFACKVVGCTHAEPFASLAEVRAHYKSEHPGVRSPRAPRPSRAKTSGPVLPGHANEPESGGSAPGNPPDPPGADTLDFDAGETAPAAPAGMELTPREPERRGWRSWFGLPPKRDRAPSSSPSSRKVRREDSSEFWGGGYSLVGTALERLQVDPPLGRLLQFQSIGAGEILNTLTADTALDSMVQPLVRNAEAARGLGALVGLPLLIFMYERLPEEARPALEKWMLEAVKAQAIAMVPAVKKKRARDREFEKAIAELAEEGLIDPELAGVQSADAVADAILMQIFRGPPPPPEGAPETNGEPAWDARTRAEREATQ